MFRVHQFSKVEMFIISEPTDSDRLHEELLQTQIDIVEDLGLHARVLDMPADDLGAPAYRKYDIEAWMPSRGDYGEVRLLTVCCFLD